MKTFLNKDPADSSINWSETQIQIYIAQESRKLGLIFASDQSGINKTKVAGNMAKLMGSSIGEPDLRYYCHNGVTLLIELKKTKGVLSEDQKKRIGILKALGFDVRVIYADSPEHGWEQVRNVVMEYWNESK